MKPSLKTCPVCTFKNYFAAPNCERCLYDFVQALPPACPTPFIYLGNKQKCAADVWEVFGPTSLFVDPFFGSGAMLRARPDHKAMAVCNDASGLIANFFRAVKDAPEEVAAHIDPFVHEADLVARQRRLLSQLPELKKKLFTDPDFFCAKSAAWFCGVQSNWIGGNAFSIGSTNGRRIDLSHRAGIQRKKPLIGNKGVENQPNLKAYFYRLATCLTGAKFPCGDWQRVCVKAVIGCKPCALFFDPPYSCARKDYYMGELDPLISRKVAAFAVQAVQKYPKLKVAVCELDGVLNDIIPKRWLTYRWLGTSGWAGKDNDNRTKERIYFSPGCNRIRDLRVLKLV